MKNYYKYFAEKINYTFRVCLTCTYYSISGNQKNNNFKVRHSRFAYTTEGYIQKRNTRKSYYVCCPDDNLTGRNMSPY
jgi:hypothetical protein